jgi:hypothetical protein
MQTGMHGNFALELPDHDDCLAGSPTGGCDRAPGPSNIDGVPTQ